MTESPTLLRYEQSCKELLLRLNGDLSPLANSLRAEVRAILDVLDTWRVKTPAVEQRTFISVRVLDVFRLTMDYLVSKPSILPGIRPPRNSS